MKLRDADGSANYFVPFSNGVFKQPHVRRIGPAFPLFGKLEDWVTTGDGEDGLPHGGRPITDQELADELGVHRKTVARWRRRLVRHNYVGSKPTPAGNILRVRKSKKWLWLRSVRGGPGPTEVGADSLPGGSKFEPSGSKSGMPNKTIHRQKQDVVAAAAEDSWKSIGADLPMGTAAFQGVWQFLYTHRDGALVSEAMERAIQRCQAKRIPVPPPFFAAKRAIEAQERAAPETADLPRLEAPPWKR